MTAEHGGVLVRAALEDGAEHLRFAAGSVAQADLALRVPGVLASVRAPATEQAAYGYVLGGQAEGSVRALAAAR